MAKSITATIIDIGPEMAQLSHDTSYSSLELAKEFVSDIYAQKVIAGKKLDFIQASVTYFRREEGDFEEVVPQSSVHGVAKICGCVAPPGLDEIEIIRGLNSEDTNNGSKNGSTNVPKKEEEGTSEGLRLLLAILQAIEDIASFVGKKKFPSRNIILVTNFEDLRDEPSMDASNAKAAQCLQIIESELRKHCITLSVYNVGVGSALADLWKHALEKNSDIVNFYSCDELIDQMTHPSKRTVRPVSVFSGKLRFFHDPVAVFVAGERFKNPSADEAKSLEFDVEAYPCTKDEHGISQNFFHRDVLSQKVDPGRLSLKRSTNYTYMEKRPENEVSQIKSAKRTQRQKKKELEPHAEEDDPDKWEDSEDDDVYLYKQKPVSQEHLSKAYNYMSEHVPVSSALEQQRLYHTVPGIDFLGVVERSKLPRWFLIGESVWVVAKNGSQASNQTGLAALIEALIGLRSALVARYVKKRDTETQIVLLLPHCHQKKHWFSMVQLPTKENVRNATFPKLDVLKTKTGETITSHPKLLPDANLRALMDSFVSQNSVEVSPVMNPAIHVPGQVIKYVIKHGNNTSDSSAIDAGNLFEDALKDSLTQKTFNNVSLGSLSPSEVPLQMAAKFAVSKLPESEKIEDSPEIEMIADYDDELQDLDDILELN